MDIFGYSKKFTTLMSVTKVVLCGVVLCCVILFVVFSVMFVVCDGSELDV